MACGGMGGWRCSQRGRDAAVKSSSLISAESQRAVQALQDEMELMGPSRLRDVEAAQTNIVSIVRRLEEAGEIVIGGGDDDLIL